MNILIICYCYPPDFGPRASRWSAIAEYWATQGYQVHVISGGILGALSSETLNGVQVHGVGGTEDELYKYTTDFGGAWERPNTKDAAAQGSQRGGANWKLWKWIMEP